MVASGEPHRFADMLGLGLFLYFLFYFLMGLGSLYDLHMLFKTTSYWQ